MPQKNIQDDDATPLAFENIDLSDVIDAPALQEMMDDYFTLTGFAFAIVDMKGEVLVKGGWQDICVKFHRAQPESCRFCHESDTSLSSGVAPGVFKTYRCKNNMWDIATPIMLGDRHVGNIFMGQLMFDDEEPDYELFRAQARRFGYDETAYIAALDRVPRYNRELVNTAMSFCSKLAQVISKSNYNNIVLAQTLTERKLAEDALRESESEFRSLAEAMPQIVWITRSDGWNIFFNQQWMDYTGLTLEESYGNGWIKPFHPDDQQRAWDAWQKAVQNNGVYSLECRLRRADGVYKWWLVRGVPVLDAKGTILKWFGTCTDIDELKHNEDNLQAKNAELERFTYTVSHDLKSPIITIKGFTGSLEKDLAKGNYERMTKDLKRVSDAADRMNDLLRDLLELSTIGRIIKTPEQVDMNLLAADVLAQLAGPLMNRNLTVAVQPGLPEVLCDRRRMAEVLQNLIENAVNYMGDQAEPRIEFGMREEAGENIFFVQDNGIGIDEKYHRIIFGLFNKLNAESGGTGIGLALVKRIIEVHGGRVWVVSEGEGLGSRFCFTIKGATK